MARNTPRVCSRFLRLKFAPADIAAVEAVGEIDLVDGAVGPGPRVGERLCDRGDRKDSPAFGDKPGLTLRSSSMEHGHAFHLLGRFDLLDDATARRGAG